MKPVTAAAALMMIAGIAAAPQAQAKGCLKGAAAGAVAGHFMHHHAVLGAIAGCAIGHHIAAEKARAQKAQAAKHPQQHGASGH